MSKSEYERQLELVAVAGRRAPETADPLLQELERATVVEMRQIPPDVVRLGSKVTYKRDGAEPQEVSLVLPAAADISAGTVSVLTPIGTALIGLRSEERRGGKECGSTCSTRWALYQ